MPLRNTIQVFEHEKLFFSDDSSFKKQHWETLSKYCQQSKDKYFEVYHNCVKFSQYVGALQVGNLTIEILPKADKQETDKNLWRDNLIKMLRECRLLRVESLTNAYLKLRSNNILDMYIELFINEVQKLVNQGLVKKYRREEGNCFALKGRLLFNQHLNKNMVHKERFYISYQLYDRDNVYNRIIYKTLCILPDIIREGHLKDKLNRVLINFPEVSSILANNNLFDNLKYGRKTERYRNAIDIARLLLLNYRPDIQHGSRSLIAILFDMNRLWEEYIFRQFRKIEGVKASRQQSRKFWKPDAGNNKTIRPDIVIEKEDEKIIVDTKWKLVSDNRPSDDDLKQMFTYKLFWGIHKSILLYPGKNTNSSGSYCAFPNYDYSGENLFCKLGFVDVSELDLKNSVEELVEVLNKLINYTAYQR
jgi:5-methylcytosine-specific restriction enzyme subunit McrC